MSNDGPSLAGRAALAVALTIGFYLLALTVALGLIGFAVAGVVTEDVPFNIWLAIFCVVTGLTILRAIIPRRHRFEPPGPEVTADDQPELLGEVRRVADEVGEPLPAAVYITHDLNAAVTEDRRLGRPAKRILLLGLPILELLSPAELRAVIAHEYGHYVGGDTRVGPWIWRTRATIGRTLGDLHDEESWGRRIIIKPFEWYTSLFLRLTNAVSRRQEFAADALAARVEGVEPQACALRRIHAAAPAFDDFFSGEVVPVLERGRRPPMGPGFRRFLLANPIQEAVNRYVSEHLRDEKTDPYDSHPSLNERLSALGASTELDEVGPADEPAAALLRDRDEVERRVLATMFGEEAVRPLRPIDWDDVGGEVIQNGYRRLVTDFGAAFEDVTIADAPAVLADLEQAGRAIARIDGETAESDRPEIAGTTIAAATALALADRGWTVDAPPGEPVVLRRGAETRDPFADAQRVAAGELDEAGWRERYADAADVRVGSLVGEPEPASAA